jgi:hypothetical protein
MAPAAMKRPVFSVKRRRQAIAARPQPAAQVPRRIPTLERALLGWSA